jgi:hypothetical protein
MRDAKNVAKVAILRGLYVFVMMHDETVDGKGNVKRQFLE